MIKTQLSLIPDLIPNKVIVTNNNKQLSIYDIKKKVTSSYELSDVDIIMRVKPNDYLNKKLKKVSVDCVTYDIDNSQKDCKFIAFILRDNEKNKLIFSLEIKDSYLSYNEITPIMRKIASVYNISLPDHILIEILYSDEYIEED